MRRWAPFLFVMPFAALIAVPGSRGTSAPSANRLLIAYESAGQIHVMRADGTGAREVANGGSPSWSPNGRLMAFQSARIPGDGLDIYVMDADGRNQRRIVTHSNAPQSGPNTNAGNARDDSDPAWSPNSDVMAFVSDRTDNDEIWITNGDGHGTGPLTINPAKDRDPAWSPDGSRLVFTSDRGGNDDIYSMDTNGNDVRRVTSNPGSDRAPAWSPSGNLIAFQSTRDGNAEIYSIAPDGSGQHRLTFDPGEDTNPSWSPDGSRIMFTSDRSGSPGIYTMDTAEGSLQRLTAPIASADRADWQPAVDLTLSVAAPTTIRRSRQGRLRITITNLLPKPAFNLMLRGSMPPGVKLLRVRPSEGSCAGGLMCSLGELQTAATVDAVFRPSRCNRVTIAVSVSSLQMDLDLANNRRRVSLRVRC
jgi:dipeptidyl aminopeptidase/acylaminoacyl peptidase